MSADGWMSGDLSGETLAEQDAPARSRRDAVVTLDDGRLEVFDGLREVQLVELLCCTVGRSTTT